MRVQLGLNVNPYKIIA